MKPPTTHRAPRPGAAGLTLVEALIATTLLAVLFLAVAQTSSRASDAFDEGNAEHVLSTNVHRAIERMARTIELSDGSILAANQGSLTGESGDDAVVFRIPVDFVAGAVTWMDVEYFAEREPGELDNGADDDGDNLVDEFRVVELLAGGAPDERRTVILSGVPELAPGEILNNLDDDGDLLRDEAGLSFSADGDVVTIRLAGERQDDSGRVLTKTAETAVRLRNRF